MIYWKNYLDNKKNVKGYALVYKNYDATIHYHPVNELYEIFYGKCYLHIDGETRLVSAPYSVWIPANVQHALKPISDFVLLKYSFSSGKFDDIPYTWLKSKL